jgi:potassium efflux system protein
VQEAAGTNANLSEQLAQAVAQLEETAAAQQRLQRTLDQLQARAHTTEQQLEIAGLSRALGEVLRRERRNLPSVSQVTRRVDQRQQLIAELRLRQFQLEQERQDAESIDRQVARLLAERFPEVDPAQAPEIADRLRQLLTDRADLRQKLSINYSRLADQLLELNRTEQLLAAQALSYQELLDESLFWIASGSPVGWQWLLDVAHTLGWLVSAENWSAVGSALLDRLTETPIMGAAVTLLIGLLIAARPRLRAQLSATAAAVDAERDHIGITFQALWYTLLLALPWPLLVGAIGAMLMRGADAASFVYATGLALRNTALVVLIIEGFRQLCRDRGVAQVHFRWRVSSRRSLRRQLSWLIAAAVPVGFVITLTEAQPEELYRESLGRLAFTVGSIALAAFAWLLLRPRFPLVRGLARERRRGWWRVRRPLRLLATAVPLALAGLALYGYYYTALQLESRLISTGWLIVVLVIVGNLTLRWIRLAQQELARQRPEPAREIGRSREQVDPAKADEQTRTVFATAVTAALVGGLWLIWSDLLPALNILENLVLWESAGGEGADVVRVTVGDLVVAAAVIGLMVIAAANLPGLLEITLLRRLSIDPGNRYAITTISRYLIVAIGLLVALNFAGVRWGQAQWLIAALGVGLGFGLQEIFANFVSGLILLFERPIRVGDTVTVGNQSGQVTRIRIRATTITDWDRRELIIPNKSFITDQLTNWTLSDQITRVIIKLQVAYGSSPDQVRQLLLDCAAANPRVLRDPEPFSHFVGLTGSALELELHVFVKDLADRLPAKHELYTEAIRRLQEAGIEIPFPQRDLHIRSSPQNHQDKPGDT